MRFFDFSPEVERAISGAKDEASRMSARTKVGRMLFPGAVKRAGFSHLSPGDPFDPTGSYHALVIGAATWSDPDLAALDRLALNVQGRTVKVLVLDIDDWRVDEILKAFPGARRFRSTPLILQYKDGTLTFAGEGHEAVLWLDQI